MSDAEAGFGDARSDHTQCWAHVKLSSSVAGR